MKIVWNCYAGEIVRVLSRASFVLCASSAPRHGGSQMFFFAHVVRVSRGWAWELFFFSEFILILN